MAVAHLFFLQNVMGGCRGGGRTMSSCFKLSAELVTGRAICSRGIPVAESVVNAENFSCGWLSTTLSLPSFAQRKHRDF